MTDAITTSATDLVGLARPLALQRIGAGKDPNLAYGTRRALLSALRSNGINTLRQRRG